MVYPGGKTVSYSYDSMNRMIGVTDWLANTTTYYYDPNGNLVASTNLNGTAANYDYDQADRLIGLTNSAPNGLIISSYAYTLDAVGNHTQVEQAEQLPSTPFVGNLTYAYDDDNRMLRAGNQTNTFDANGNLVAINATNLLSYDDENRLTRTIFDSVTNNYHYDGNGNRLSAARDGVIRRYVLDRARPLTQVLAETDPTGSNIAFYVYGLGLISRIDAGEKIQYYHFDSRGSTIALTDAAGQLTSAYAYDPFGNLRAANGLTDDQFRYLGRHGVMDEDNGLYYIRARYYSPSHGRFITKDPMTGTDGDSQGLNRYIYALNNPLVRIDPSGYYSWVTAGIGALQYLNGVSSIITGAAATTWSSQQLPPRLERHWFSISTRSMMRASSFRR